MTILFKRLLIPTTLAFVVYLLGALLMGDVYAATAVEELRNKGQQCATWAHSRDQGSDHALACVTKCGRYANFVQNNPDLLTVENVQKCNDAYANAKNHSSGTKTPAAPTANDQNATKAGRVRTTVVHKTSMTPMPDIEGVFLQTTRSGFRVRAEGRKDWKTYCNEAAFIKNGQDNFSRTIKAQERVRFVGISYDESKANKPISHCVAENVIILGSNK